MESESSNLYSGNSKENPYETISESNYKPISDFPDYQKKRSNSYSPTQSVRKRDLSISQNVSKRNAKTECIKKEFLLFCQNTTIRGVSRIVKSTDKKIFILWLGFFIILCLGLFVCMFFLWRQYLEYNVIHPPRVLSNQNAPFPSFTICNLRPLSPSVRSFLNRNNLRNPREFAKRLNQYAVYYYLNKNRTQLYEASTAISSMGGYLESMPNVSYFDQLGHGLNDMVISCKVNYVEGNKPLLDECENVGKWRTILHPQYINCYSFNLYQKFSNKTITIELFVYLAEEFNTTECIDCFLTNVKTQLSGAVLVIHNTDSYPDINQESVNLQPGTLTEVKLKTIQNIMKTPPYGRCSKYTQKYLRISGEDYSYSEVACKFVTFQQKINEECRCIATEFPFIDNSSLPLCTALSSFISNSSCSPINPHNKNISPDKMCLDEMDKAVERSLCKNNITRRYHGDGIQGCYLPCHFYSYETDRSISTWPTKTYQLNWIKSSVANVIRNKPELDYYKKALEKLKMGDEAGAYEILTNQNVLEKKLVGVVINKPNYNLHVVEEKEVLSLTSFLSQSGGLFSIWIGLTLINIVEIIEMLIHFAEIDKNKNQSETKVVTSFEIRSQPCEFQRYVKNESLNFGENALDPLTTVNNQPREAMI